MAKELLFQVEVRGFDELSRKLRSIPRDVALRIMRAAVRAGAEVIQGNIKNKTPVQSGALRESIKVTTEQIVRNAEVSAFVVSEKKKAFYAHMVERGHKWILKRYGKVVATGFKEAKPFFRPGVDASRNQVATAMRDVVERRLARELKRAFQG